MLLRNRLTTVTLNEPMAAPANAMQPSTAKSRNIVFGFSKPAHGRPLRLCSENGLGRSAGLKLPDPWSSPGGPDSPLRLQRLGIVLRPYFLPAAAAFLIRTEALRVSS